MAIGKPVMTYREGSQSAESKKVIKRGKYKDAQGKEWDLEQFDDTGSLTKAKKKK